VAFATTDDLRVELGITTFTEDQEARALRRIDGATGAIQRYTRQTIELTSGDVAILTGSWTPALVLPELPVTAVTSVVIDGETLTADTDYQFDGQRTLWRGDAVHDWSDWPWRYPRPHECHWGGPETKITVTYSHGFDPVPPEVVEICVAMALRGWDTPTGATSETIGSWSASYGTSVAGGAVSMTREERRILNELRRRWAA
jgi:hypothetical protein